MSLTDRPRDPMPEPGREATPGSGAPATGDEVIAAGEASVVATGGPAATGGRSGGSQALWLIGGIVLVVGATILGGAGAIGPILEPPFPAGLLLGVAAGILGIVVVLRAIARIGPARTDARELIRAVRLLFVAVGLFAAAAGWIVGSALPIVVGLVIVGIDVIETSFLLIITAARRDDPAPEP